MDTISFSFEEISALNLEQIHILLDYYGIKYPKKAGKKKLLEKIEPYFVKNSVQYISPDGEEIQMSVRIRRIKESNNVR